MKRIEYIRITSRASVSSAAFATVAYNLPDVRRARDRFRGRVVVRGRTNGRESVAQQEGRKTGRKGERQRQRRGAQKSPVDRIGCVWSCRFALYKTYISRECLSEDAKREASTSRNKEGKRDSLLVSRSRQNSLAPALTLDITKLLQLSFTIL